MNIKDIEKDVLTKAENNLNPNTSFQLTQELQDKWGIGPVFDVTNKLKKQGYLTNCHFFMGGGFLLGYPTPAGSEYLKELNHVNKEEHSTVYQNNFNSTVSIDNLQQGHNNLITENKNQIDYSALLKTIEEINELKQLETLKAELATNKAIITALSKTSNKSEQEITKLVKMAKGLVSEDCTIEQALDEVLALIGKTTEKPQVPVSQVVVTTPETSVITDENPFKDKNNIDGIMKAIKENPERARQMAKAVGYSPINW